MSMWQVTTWISYIYMCLFLSVCLWVYVCVWVYVGIYVCALPGTSLIASSVPLRIKERLNSQ
jgi:hypothetical protein